MRPELSPGCTRRRSAARTTAAVLGVTLTFGVGFPCFTGCSASSSPDPVRAEADEISQIASTTQTLTWLQAPGALVRSDCVHHVPNGASIEMSGDVTLNGVFIAHYDPCPVSSIRTRPSQPGTAPSGAAPSTAPPPGTGGWVEGAQRHVSLSSGTNLDYLVSGWAVPEDPVSDGALIYLFNGLEPEGQALILQPVLQWGVGAAGGGDYWAIASWLVAGSTAYISPLETVSAGDQLVGVNEVTSQSGSPSTLYWKILAQDETSGAYTYITPSTYGYQWTWAYTAILEAYNVTSCAQFPSTYVAYEFWDTSLYNTPPYTLNSDGSGFSGTEYAYGYAGTSPYYDGPNCGFSGSYFDSAWFFSF